MSLFCVFLISQSQKSKVKSQSQTQIISKSQISLR